MSTYHFRYSAIATTSLEYVDSSGGYYGSGSNVYTGSTGVALGTDISTELGVLVALYNSIYDNIISVSSSVPMVGNQIYSDPSVTYAISSTLSGTVTLLSYDPADVFYLYLTPEITSSVVDLTGVSIVCEGNLQTYNVYILCPNKVLLGDHAYHGNFLVAELEGVSGTSVDGSVSALNETSGAISTLSVRMGCPRYFNAYAAIAPTISFPGDFLTINGGKYGMNQSDQNYRLIISGTSKLDTVENATTEITYIKNFMDSFTGFKVNYISNTIDLSVAHTESIPIYPISTNNYYTISGQTESATIEFVPSSSHSSSDVFYIYNDSNFMYFITIKFSIPSTVNIKNIYIFNSNGDICFNQDSTSVSNYTGTFISGGSIYSQGTSQIETVVNGSLYGVSSAYVNTSAILELKTINFTGASLSITYPFTYSAISSSSMTDIAVKGGLYGSGTGTDYGTVTATGGASLGTTISDELVSLGILWNDIFTDLGKSPPFYCLDGDFVYSNPLVWYEIRTNVSGSITFSSVNPIARFYMYITNDPIDLSNLSIVCGGNVQYSNIYIISKGAIILGANDYYGNFLVGDITGVEGTRVIGTVSALNSETIGYGSATGTMTMLNIIFTTPCFMQGTKVLTDQWYIPVEKLKVGDMVMTYGELHDKCHVRDNVRPMPIVNIMKYVRRASPASCPVVFTKNAFGVNAPYEDLYVSPNHGMVDRKGRLFPAKKFVNNSSIFQDPTFETVTYYHLELERHCAVLVNGVLAETYNLPKKFKSRTTLQNGETSALGRGRPRG
jgi:hypothetical protein